MCYIRILMGKVMCEDKDDGFCDTSTNRIYQKYHKFNNQRVNKVMAF